MTAEANNAEWDEVERVKRRRDEQRARELDRVEYQKEARRARDCARVKAWQRAQRAKGQCRCGARIAPESKSRCWECLERSRRNQAAQRGRPVRGRRRRGRPLLGSLGVRRRAFEQQEQRRAWRKEREAERQAERRRKRWI